MAHNTYIRGCSVEWADGADYRGLFVYGTRLFDPRQMIEPHNIPAHLLGKPHEMVLHIAGSTYYPTRDGYFRWDHQQ